MVTKKVVQTHHLEYQRKDSGKEKTGQTVKLWKGEHWAITQMQRRKFVSIGFIKAIRYWIDQVEEDAVELDEVLAKPDETLE